MLKSLSIPITEPSQVGEARRQAQRLAAKQELSATATGQIGIIATELGTNLHKHAKGGELLLRKLVSGKRRGVEMLAIDRGPGMTDLNRCMADGYSTTGTVGNGLGSIKRLSHVFEAHSTNSGTAIVSQMWSEPASSITGPDACYPSLNIGAICIPYPHETICGDSWTWSPASSEGHHSQIFIADGLGHGYVAAEASDKAVALFDESPLDPPQIILKRIHNSLRSTRGAAGLVLQFNYKSRKVICSGVGNISAALYKSETSKHFVSMNGTLGHQMSRFQDFDYDWPASSTVIAFSDGLQSRWKPDVYPGLLLRHPSLIAAVLYRDFRRERDDVTVLVIRELPR
ncbi:MAG: ATP-binding protein [Candidatus Methylacidiphilales bacterium]|nr:ATP-binding SpoIIE family protein phosphatase [Candidatus Methylacidiphilales bacterium]